MVAETSEASKDQQCENATGENNTCKCTCSEKVLPVKTTCARARVAKSAACETTCARARVAKSAAIGNNTCTCMCRICNLISAMS